jgi:hypothetical protein
MESLNIVSQLEIILPLKCDALFCSGNLKTALASNYFLFHIDLQLQFHFKLEVNCSCPCIYTYIAVLVSRLSALISQAAGFLTHSFHWGSNPDTKQLQPLAGQGQV